MVLINYATKEIVAKIVYYGPGLCGKTTNLQQIYLKLNPKKRGKMISLATEADRTLFFDFLPMELGTVQGFKVRFQLYTVPGQVFYGATRRLVLKGADAVVFVADSQTDVFSKNVESIEDMKQNLIENNLDPDAIPVVFQYNKRDLDNILDMETLDRDLNYRGLPYFGASAIDGTGVMDTFKEITRLLLQYLKSKHAFLNTDKLKDLPPEVFEYKKEPPPEEVKQVEYELELGSAIREDANEGDVVAGELLDQIETISLADSIQAEAFFDNVRKGESAEDARQKAELVAAQQAEATEELMGSMESFLEDAPIAPSPSGNVETIPEDTVTVIERFEPEPVKWTEPEPEPKPVVKPAAPPPPPPPPKKAPAEEEYMGMDMTSPDMIEPDGAVFDALEAAPSIPAEPVPTPAPAAMAATSAPAPQPAAPPVDISPVVLALDRLDRQVAALIDEVAELKSTLADMSVEKETDIPLQPAPSVQPDITSGLEEMGRGLKAAIEGQDRLLLSILESVRESKRTNSDSHEKMEDAVKYLIDKIRDDSTDEGKGGRKKWF